jgi:hypothetical protein
MADEGRQPPSDSLAGTLGRDETPALDPDAVRRSYQEHRARRRARIEHDRRNRWAGARFWVVFLLLVAAFAVLALTTWREIGRLFGL